MNIPKGLPCQHTFCAPCLDKFIHTVNENGEEPQCPKCKAGFSVPKEGARKLPTNLSVQDMIELKMHQAMLPQDSMGKPAVILKHYTCKEHAGKHAIMVCIACEIELCTDCVKVLHKSKHRKHELEDIETYLSNYRNDFERLKERSQRLPKLYDQAKKAADRNLKNTKRKKESEIDQYAERAIQQVRIWQQTQKNYIYSPFLKCSALDRNVSSSAMETFSSNVDMLGNITCKKLPSIRAMRGFIYELEKLEKGCHSLGNTTYQKPPIKPIILQLGNIESNQSN